MANTSERIEAWIRLKDAARFARDAHRSAQSIREIGRASGSAEKQNMLLARTSQRAHTIIHGVGVAALYTVGGLGLLSGAAAAAGLALGIKFNANMEQLEVAFANFLGSTQAASKYLQELYHIAAVTPFEFPDLAAAARKFLAFGFAANDTKKILMTVGDTVAGLGGGADEIQRMVLAFGQIKAKGRLQSDELLQFAELGVPAYKILGDQLQLTGTELQTKLRKGAISADTAIRALQKGMQQTFGGSSAQQARTFTGLLSTMKDNAMATLGALSKPAFDFTKRRILPPVAHALAATQQWAQTGGPGRAVDVVKGGFQGKKTQFGGEGFMTTFNKVLQKVGQVAGVVIPFLVKGFNIAKGVILDLLKAIKPAAPFFENVLGPVLKGLAVGIIGAVVSGFKGFIFIIKILAHILGFLGKIMKPFKPLFYGLGFVIGFVFGGAILRALGFISKFATILSIPIRVVDGLITGFVGLVAILFRLSPAFKFLFPVIGFIIRRFGFLWGLVKFGFKLWGKFGWLIGYYIVKRFGSLLHPVSLVRGAFHVLGHVFGIVAAAIGSIIRAVVLLQDKLASVIGPLKEFLGLTGKPGKKKGILGLGGIHKFDSLFHATGGVIPANGIGVVGEQGPEIASAGSQPLRITPIAKASAGPGIHGVIHIHTEVPVKIGTREIARASAHETADWKARKGRRA